MSGLTAGESTQLGVIDILRKLMANKMVTDPATGKIIIYDDDDVAIALEADIFEDIAGAQPYRGRGIERRDRLT